MLSNYLNTFESVSTPQGDEYGPTFIAVIAIFGLFPIRTSECLSIHNPASSLAQSINSMNERERNKYENRIKFLFMLKLFYCCGARGFATRKCSASMSRLGVCYNKI